KRTPVSVQPGRSSDMTSFRTPFGPPLLRLLFFGYLRSLLLFPIFQSQRAIVPEQRLSVNA
ncbi:MAG: hypothetical protein ACI9ON_003042, partial [Limisphaerales bacterium]